jgi:hypothetical protein
MIDHRLRGQTSHPVGTLVFLLWGLIMWGSQFTASYSLHTLFCRLHIPDGIGDFTIGLLAAFAVAAIVPAVVASKHLSKMLRVRVKGEDRQVLIKIGQLIAGLSLVASVWTAAGLIFVEACAQGR